MELIQGIIQPPKAQSVEETIPTLCDRLENSTLISDRRSAVLGLKSFSREYRETVVASGLKSLINTLVKDQEDEDLVRAVLETLLILFIRGEGEEDLTRNWISQQSRLQNGKYPSPLVMKEENESVDQFSLWITDALTQTDEVIKLLFTFLDSSVFQIKLYSIQLLEALIATRPTKAREVILNIPTGVSNLVKLLDDINEPIRDETILLLMAVVNDNSHFQKLVAFENVFEKLFSIIDDEGGLRGSLVVNDCLSLVNNILKYNTSNQTLFFETGNLQHLINLLREPLSTEEEFFWNEQRIKNVNTVLDIIRLTVEDGNTVTKAHQDRLFEAEGLMVVLRLAFFIHTPNDTRLTALLTIADMIRSNSAIQHKFSQIDVPYWDPSMPSSPVSAETKLVPVTTLLLSWTLNLNSVHIFDIRVASLELLKSYFLEKENRVSLLADQIEKFNETSDSIESNTNASVLEPIFNYDPNLNLNPYKLFFSTDLLMFFISCDKSEGTTLSMLRDISFAGDIDDNDDEKMVAVQTVGELLITSFNSKDIRIPIAFLSFLIFWLYEDPVSVSQFLSNKSLINSLVSFAVQVEHQDTSLRCLVTMLLGVIYEFSSPDSPLTRKDLYGLLISRISEDNYSSRIKQLRESELFTSSPESYLAPSFDETGLPNIFFSTYFIDLVNKNIYRIQSSLKRPPDELPAVKITFELYDQLLSDFHKTKLELTATSAEYKEKADSLNKELDKVTEKLQRIEEEKNQAESELKRMTSEYADMKRDLEQTKENLHSVSTTSKNLEELKIKNSTDIAEKEKLLQQLKDKVERLEQELLDMTNLKLKAEDGINKMSRELFSLTKEKESLKTEVTNLNNQLQKHEKSSSTQIASLQKQITAKDQEILTYNKSLKDYREKNNAFEKKVNTLTKEKEELDAKLSSQTALIPKLTEKLKSLANNYKDLEAEKEECEKQYLEENATIQKSLNEANAKIEMILEEKTSLIKQLDELKQNHKIETLKIEESLARLSTENSEKTATIIHLQNSIKELQSQLDVSSSQNDQLEEKIKVLNAKCLDLEKSLNIAKKSSADSASTIEELNDSIIAINEELQAVTSERDSLSSINKTLLEEKNSYEDTIKEKDVHLEEVKKSLDGLEINIQQLKDDHDKKVLELQDTIDQKEFKLSELQDNINALEHQSKTTIDALNSEIEALNTKIKEFDSLQASRDELTSELENKSQKIKSLQEDFVKNLKKEQEKSEELVSKLAEKDTKVLDLESKVEDLTKSIALSQEKLEAKDIELKKHEINVKEKIASLESLNHALNSAKKENQDLLSSLEQEKAKAKKEQEKLIENLSSAKSELKEKIEELEEERKLLTEGSSELNQQFSAKISKLEGTLEKTKTNYEKKMQGLEDTIDSLREQSKKVDKELEEEVNKLRTETDKRQKLEKLIAQKDKEIQDYKEKLDLSDSNLVSLTEKLKSTNERLDEAIKNSSELEALSEKEKEKTLEGQNKIRALEAEIESTKGLQSEIDDVKKELASVIKEKTFLSNEVKALEEKLSELESKTEADTSQITSLENELKQATANVDVSNNKIKESETLLEKTRRNLEILQDQYNEVRDNFELKSTELNAVMKENHELKLEFEAHKTSNDSLLNSLKKENQELLENISKLKDELLQKEKSTVDLEQSSVKEREKLSKELSESTSKLTVLSEEKDSLNKEITILKKELSEWKKRAEDRSEIDELMILVSELDEQKSKYKQKLCDLGVEISSDEEEEGSDDGTDED